MSTNVTSGKEATNRLIKGFKIASENIKITYGPLGLNGVIERDISPGHEVANDAYTLVLDMNTTDPVEKRGLGFAKELMTRADMTTKDGRKTTLLIADEILNQAKDNGGMKLKRELDELIPLVEAKIDGYKRPITVDEVSTVAQVAGGYKRISKLLGEIYQHIGKDGIIHPEPSGSWTDEVKYIDGVRFISTGFLTDKLVHDEEALKNKEKETKAVYEKPTILVTKRKINHINDINPLLATLISQQKKDLVIFTDDMDSGVAAQLIDLHVKKTMNVLIIKAPILWKQYVFEDFAKITGSTIVEDATGLNFKNLPLSALGTCGKLIVDKEETTVIGIKDITDHLQELKDRGDTDSKLRLSWLQTKSAILKLGANNESELSHLRLKTADAIHSSRLALMDGVVIGGGYTLNMVADELPDTVAGNILKNALKVPFGIIGNEDEDIVDASIVVKNAVRNAVSLASTILTLGLVIHKLPMSEEELLIMKLQASQRPYQYGI